MPSIFIEQFFFEDFPMQKIVPTKALHLKPGIDIFSRH